MCGLISVFYPDGVDLPLDALEHGLDASLETIKYRGPDSRGTYISPGRRAGLGHVRLSIIDLPTGQQPLSDEENSIHCVVTGEIYDHDRIRAEMESQGYSFKSKSDSELVVQLYKRDGFNLLFGLRGEFAFVLYDVKRQLVFAARDRFGIKPLYYTVSNGSILLGSEIKAFMGLGWQAEWDIECIINHGDLCSDERPVFKRVKKLPAGSFAVCRASGDIETQLYWDLSYSSATTSPSTSLDSMISTIRDHLVEAVRLRLRSDVPLAIYLSGGIDSSAIAGIATHLLREKDPSAKLTAFTLAYVEDETTDESPLADRTAAHLGANLIKVDATEARLVGVLEESIWHSEFINNTFRGAGKLLLSKAVHDAGYKVALSEEGSDELFGGYPWFPLDYLRSPDPAAATLGIPLPSEAERHALSEEYQAATGMAQLPPNAMSLHKSEGPRHMLNISAHLALGAFWTPDAKTFRTEVVQHVGRLGLPRAMEEGINMRIRQKSVSGEWHSLHVALYFVAKTLMGRGILNLTGDRNDMANSIESRLESSLSSKEQSVEDRLVDLSLKSHDARLTVLCHALIGAYIADAHLGRYNTIIVTVFIALIGHIILIISAVPGVIEKSQTALGMILFAQIVMGFGTGLFKLLDHISIICSDKKCAVAWWEASVRLALPQLPGRPKTDRSLVYIESHVAFLDHHLVDYVNSLPPSVEIRPIPGDAPGKWTLVEKWILRQAVQPFITEEVFLRKKVQFNPPPSPAPGVVSDLLPLQVHLKAHITEASVEQLGFVEWPVVRDVLVEYLEAPMFLAQGGIDAKARALMTVLSYIVLQERFNVLSYRV
ncbi:hypothetical protein DFH08DRAFT_972607 [Mycena albidolilacea]|uniref:Glutamine amidotransferase type-2 domain-containing protein n=1 Tax=Mycena albidolilacea TaxID=1033008 RepID=A0AAD6ZAE5_9AGAR|nr:hypothetical protein DFH08DRAFT_972607 [Mycena albidolilacea]